MKAVGDLPHYLGSATHTELHRCHHEDEDEGRATYTVLCLVRQVQCSQVLLSWIVEESKCCQEHLASHIHQIQEEEVVMLCCQTHDKAAHPHNGICQAEINLQFATQMPMQQMPIRFVRCSCMLVILIPLPTAKLTA